jgi:monoamine oxidase
MDRNDHQRADGKRTGTGPTLVPDFPFPYEQWLKNPHGLGSIPSIRCGEEVAIVGAGVAGLVAAYELMKIGLKPIVYESSRIGGRLRSHTFAGTDGVIAELGGMRFPASSAAFYHYVEKLGLPTEPFPNPFSAVASSTVVNLEGETYYAEKTTSLPSKFREVADAWTDALENDGRFSELQRAMHSGDVRHLKEVWNDLVSKWDDRSFYDFVAKSRSFAKLTFSHREMFGQVGFGMGGWDSDFPNSMLEVLRVVVTNCDENQYLIRGGAEQVPQGIWQHRPDQCEHWEAGTSISSLNDGAPRVAVERIVRNPDGSIGLVDGTGITRNYEAVLITCQSLLLTAGIDCDTKLFSDKMWTALNRTHYMQSSKTFVMVDRPFWKDKDPETGQDRMSVTLTDRMTRSTYLFDNGDGKPGVICLSYTWMGDALKMLPHSVHKRVRLALDVLNKIYPKIDIRRHVVGEPVTVSWEAEPHFLGAFKGALPGHYRYNQLMYSHFMQQQLPIAQRGIFLAGDDISWTPGWVEGAVQTSLNAVWGILAQLGGSTSPENPGPGDAFEAIRPVELAD